MIKEKPDFIVREWNFATKKLLENKCGIYIIYLNKTLCLYVGASENLKSRVTQAFTPTKNTGNRLLYTLIKHYPFVRDVHVKIFFHEYLDLRELEQSYINKMNPRLNKEGRLYETYKYLRSMVAAGRDPFIKY